MSVHVFIQKTPSMVAGIDFTKSHLVPADSRDEALSVLKAGTYPPNEESEGLRNDGGNAYNVQYLGTVEELTNDGTRLVELTKRFDSEESFTIEGLPSGGDD